MFFAPLKSRLRAKIWIMGISKISNHIQIKIKIPTLSQAPPVSSKAPNEDLKDIAVLCTFKIKMESQNLDQGYIKGLKGHGWSLHLQNQDRDPKF